MIGANDAVGTSYSKVPYIERPQELDLEGNAVAQNEFLENWRNALGLAKETGVPGMVCDFEFCVKHKAYELSELAHITSKPRQDVLNAQSQVGARMADVAMAEYPGAK
jgi:hypothetical protein